MNHCPPWLHPPSGSAPIIAAEPTSEILIIAPLRTHAHNYYVVSDQSRWPAQSKGLESLHFPSHDVALFCVFLSLYLSDS